jgi:DNA-binding NtrC family response regulator
VLVVEDDEFMREFLQQLMIRLGLQVSCAAAPAAAERLLRLRRFALVVTDLDLDPARGGEGLALARWVRERAPATKVMLISGNLTAEVAEQAKAAGVSSVVGKPFDLDVFAATVDGLVGAGRLEPAPAVG